MVKKVDRMETPYEITEYDRRTRELLKENEMICGAIKLLAKEKGEEHHDENENGRY